MAAGWKSLQSGLANLNLGQSANKLTRGLSSTVQATKERLGQVAAEDITELPQEYKDLEARVDTLRQAHLALLKITKVYESETYDYPAAIQESISELGTTIGQGITNFAAANLKGTNLPAPAPVTPPAHQHKTLPHAIGRAATQAAATLQTAPGAEADKFGRALADYASAWEKIADARVAQDTAIKTEFLAPWQITLSTSIAVAVKARQAVRASRLELDAAKQTLKTASPTKQEAARIEVENAEDDLVQKTEVAITLMKAVLDNPEPLKNLNELTKAQASDASLRGTSYTYLFIPQLIFYASSAEALSSVQGEIEELSVAADGEYRKSRDH
ncbi:uncharacterized protein PHACADRAFT_213124 [Phanerochaete carnosa HHB-10118-sp]|uniref:BAR domain-containing protein n=1 Tax=Phanerochaete carnosa (strain HHB-10118-sp) TaxID=650164 RepID=K5VIY8_PHACS|nr:uncharacterized protein PHACADRAFT_213124 [Phanerochaete carnosa HHB-10118-sp]EKM51263.1 hypothetical protein PHACADRAFT_213124 [Phanerochaete carnosa HHB-10118-sp]